MSEIKSWNVISYSELDGLFAIASYDEEFKWIEFNYSEDSLFDINNDIESFRLNLVRGLELNKIKTTKEEIEKALNKTNQIDFLFEGSSSVEEIYEKLKEFLLLKEII